MIKRSLNKFFFPPRCICNGLELLHCCLAPSHSPLHSTPPLSSHALGAFLSSVIGTTICPTPTHPFTGPVVYQLLLVAKWWTYLIKAPSYTNRKSVNHILLIQKGIQLCYYYNINRVMIFRGPSLSYLASPFSFSPPPPPFFWMMFIWHDRRHSGFYYPPPPPPFSSFIVDVLLFAQCPCLTPPPLLWSTNQKCQLFICILYDLNLLRFWIMLNVRIWHVCIIHPFSRSLSLHLL